MRQIPVYMRCSGCTTTVYGLREGAAKPPCSTVTDWVQLKVSALTARYARGNTWRFASYGTTPLSKNWFIAPAILAQTSKDRYVDGDSYQWATLNMRLIQEINQTSPSLMKAVTSIWISNLKVITIACGKRQLLQAHLRPDL
jgi:hypothetical protein